jgi:hypothetical protein
LAEQVSKGRLSLATKSIHSIQDFVETDSRWNSMRDEDRQALFSKFVLDLKEAEFSNFKRCLIEFKNIGHITSRSSTTGENYEHIIDLLQKDKRWQVLEPIRKEREKMLKEFIESLRKK